MSLQIVLLVINAFLHGIIIGRFGIKGNEPPAVFGVLYATLAVAAFLGWPHTTLAALMVTTIGLVGLAVNFKMLQHDTTIEKIIVVVGLSIIAWSCYLLLS